MKLNVLVVDDDLGLLEAIAEPFRNSNDVNVITASSEEDAVAALNDELFLLCFVDLQLDETNGSFLGGASVLSYAATRHPSARLIAMTTYPGLEITRETMLERLLDPSEPSARRIEGFLDKSNTDPVTLIRALVDAEKDSYAHSPVEIEDDQDLLIVDRLASHIASWSDEREPITESGRRGEVKYLLARLFGQGAKQTHGITREPRTVRVQDFEELAASGNEARTGSSGAAVFLAQTQMPGGSPGDWVVVKFDQVDQVRREARRYDLFVRFDGRARHRVELLSTAYGNNVGAICYSLAGGDPQQARTLKGPIERGESVALQVVDTLFSRAWKHWHEPRESATSPLYYLQDEFDFKARERVKEFRDGLERAVEWRRAQVGADQPWTLSERELEVSAGMAPIRLPHQDLIGRLAPRVPTCVCHGDLHAANVIFGADPTEAVRLIDYGSTGVGPRALDFVILEGSQRVIHAGAMDITSAARTVAEERRIWAGIWSTPVGELDPEALAGREADFWCRLSARILVGLRRNFNDARPEEVAQVGVLQAVRLTPMWWIDPTKPGSDRRRYVGLVRLASWIDPMVRQLHGANGVPTHLD